MQSSKYSFSKFTENLEKINTRINNVLGIDTTRTSGQTSTPSSHQSVQFTTGTIELDESLDTLEEFPHTISLNIGESAGVVNTVSNNVSPIQGQSIFFRFTNALEDLNTRINNAFTQPQSQASIPPRIIGPSDSELHPENWQIVKYSPDVTRRNNSTTRGIFTKFALDIQNISSRFTNLFKNNSNSPPSQSPINNPQATSSTNTPSYGHQRQSQNPSYCLKCIDFSRVDAHAAKFPRQSVTSLPQLAIDLTSKFSTKIEKARAIFVWLHHNIAYNTAAYLSGNLGSATPDQTFHTGLAVCQGYAELFADIGRNSGLEVLVISGHGKGYSFVPNMNGVPPPFKSNHTWNAVRLDGGEWHLLDACWGAGYFVKDTNEYVKHFKDTHFTSSSEAFRRKHFPMNPEHQMCETEMSWSEYILMKEGPIVYSNFEDYGFSEMSILPSERFLRPQNGPIKFEIKSKCKHARIGPQDQYVFLLSVDGTKTPFQVNEEGTTWTCESQWIRKGSDVRAFALEQFGGKNAKGVSVDEYLKPRFGRSSFVGLCKWET